MDSLFLFFCLVEVPLLNEFDEFWVDSVWVWLLIRVATFQHLPEPNRLSRIDARRKLLLNLQSGDRTFLRSFLVASDLQ